MANATSELTIRVGTAGIAGTLANIRSVGKTIGQLPANLQAFNQVAATLGAQVAPQLTGALQGVAGAFKTLATSAKLSIGSILPLTAGATAVFYGWKKAIDEVRGSMSALALEQERRETFRKSATMLESEIKFLAGRGRIDAKTAAGYLNSLTNARGNPEREQQVIQEIRAAIEAVQKKTGEKQADARAAQQEFDDLLRENRIQLLDGAAKEREELKRAMDELIVKGADIAARADISMKPLNDLVNEIVAKRSGEIDAEETKRRIEAETKLIEEQRKHQMEEDELRIREWEHAQRMLELERRRRIEAIQSNPFTTDADKYQLLRDEGVPASELGADPASFTQQFSAQLVQLQNQIGTFSQSSAALLAGGLGLGLQGIGESITGLITKTQNWSQVWRSVLQNMLAMSIQWGVNQLAAFTLTKTKELILHRSTEAMKTSATTSNASARSSAVLGEAGAEAVSVGAKAAGSVADIPYVGWAMAIAAFGGIVAMIASAASAAKRERGGPVIAGQPYVVGEKRPELFVPDQSGYILPSVPDNFYSGAGASPSVNVAAAPVNVVVVNDRSELKRFLESRAGERIVVKHVGKSTRGEIEIDS